MQMSVLFVIMFGLSFRGRHAWLRRLVVRTPPFQGGDRRFEPGRSYHKQAGRRREASDLFCAGDTGPKQGTSGFLVPVAVGRSPLGSLANRGPMGPQVRVAGLQGARRDPVRREPASSGRGTASRRPRPCKLGLRAWKSQVASLQARNPRTLKRRAAGLQGARAANLPAETLQVRVVSPLSREPGGKADCCGSRMARPTVMARFLRSEAPDFTTCTE